MKRICIVVGARPNFVKVAPLLSAARKSGRADCQLVYAGMADDPTLEPTLFDDLEMQRPDVCLGVGSHNLNEITAQVMAAFDHYLDKHPADVVIVVDDLASTMAAAITAKKRGTLLAHLVAGTRSFDISMPKEVNRLVIDALSDYLFTAGTRSNSVATREQQSETSATYMVGNILVDTLRHNLPRFRRPALPVADEWLTPRQYLVLTLNRRAWFTDEPTLGRLLGVVVRAAAAAAVPVLAPLRPEVRAVVERLLAALSPVGVAAQQVFVCDALTYLEFGWLTANARGIITDSGNVAEEATFNGVPCITLNSYTEHQETVTVGTNVLVGGDADRLQSALYDLTAGRWKPSSLPDRWDGRTAERIIKILTD